MENGVYVDVEIEAPESLIEGRRRMIAGAMWILCDTLERL